MKKRILICVSLLLVVVCLIGVYAVQSSKIVGEEGLIAKAHKEISNLAEVETIEFADNRISLFAAQYGRCAISGAELMPYDIRCHHKVPLENGGTDKYSNLVLVTEAVHLLIHATLEETIQKYLKQLQLNKKQFEKLNRLRKLAGTPVIA